MNWHHEPTKLLIIGKSGSGKTTAWLEAIKKLNPGYLFVFDPEKIYARRAPADFCVNPSAFAQSLVSSRRVVFCPSANSFANFGFYCSVVWKFSRKYQGTKLLAVDEIQRWTRCREGGIPDSLQEILDLGRNYEIDFCFTSHAPNKVNDAIRMQLTEVWCFRHDEPLPLKWIHSMGFDVEEVKRLKYPGGRVEKKFT